MPFIKLFDTIMYLYVWVLIIGVVLNWLVTFSVINGHNQFVRTVYQFCTALTEPVLRRIRSVIPPINGIDISPIVLILGVELIRNCMLWYIAPLLDRSPLG